MSGFRMSVRDGERLIGEISERAEARSTGWGRIPSPDAGSVGGGFPSLGHRLVTVTDRVSAMGRAGAQRFGGYSSALNRQLAGFSGVDTSSSDGLRAVGSPGQAHEGGHS